MKPARNEVEAWQEMAYALPPTREEKPEYGRGPGWVGLLIAIGLSVIGVSVLSLVN